MRCWVDDIEVGADAAELDDLGWDHGHVVGDRRIVVELTIQELGDVGARLHALAQEFESGEPGYFDDPLMLDVPVPAGAAVFADEPVQLLRYLRHPFWSRDTVIAVLGQADAGRRSDRPPTHLLQHLVDGEASRDGLTLIMSGVRRPT